MASITQKIKEKLNKGYLGKDLKYRESEKVEKKDEVVRQKDDKRFKSFSG